MGHASLLNSTSEPLFGEPARERADSLNFFSVGTKLGLKDHARLFGQIVGEATFLVELPEEFGVSKARAQDALMSGADESLGVAIEVDHREKVRRQAAIAAAKGKIFLVIAHDGDEDFFRQLQVRRIEVPQDRRRIFVQIDDELQERRIRMDAKPLPRRELGKLAVHFLVALRG